jgi:hypothetical protein
LPTPYIGKAAAVAFDEHTPTGPDRLPVFIHDTQYKFIFIMHVSWHIHCSHQHSELTVKFAAQSVDRTLINYSFSNFITKKGVALIKCNRLL